jgi:hypothetical protein
MRPKVPRRSDKVQEGVNLRVASRVQSLPPELQGARSIVQLIRRLDCRSTARGNIFRSE